MMDLLAKPAGRAKGRGHRAKGKVQSLRWLAVALCIAVCSVSISVRAETIDRVLAILPGQIITLSDLEAAIDLGLI